MPDPFHEVHQVLQAVIDQLPSAVLIVLPPSGRIAYASVALRHLSRVPDEWPLERALGGEVLAAEAITITRADGTRAPARLSSRPLHDGAGLVGAAVITVDDAGPASAELVNAQAARAAAEEANRSKDEFLATLSHELRTPLNAMLGWAQLLRGGRLDEEARRHALDTIERNAKLQAQLVEDILDVSRIVAGSLRLHLHPVDLRAVTEAAVDTVRPAAAAKGLGLFLRSAGVSVPVAGDADRLQQVVCNLVANAIKFTPRGGRIDVEVNRGVHGIVRVRDNGRGISASFLPHVFDRFRQADPAITRAHGGLGLGLAIVRHLVELHGGHVRAESAGEGHGATFTVEVPVRSVLADAAEFADDQPTLTDVTPTLDGLKLLVVDDEADTRELLGVALKQYGAEVRLAASAAEALAAMRDSLPDVLISDIGLPGENGYELIRRVRELSGGARALPAVALTAYAGDEDSQRALLAGYQMHIAKPVEPDALVSVVARVAGWAASRR